MSQELDTTERHSNLLGRRKLENCAEERKQKEILGGWCTDRWRNRWIGRWSVGAYLCVPGVKEAKTFAVLVSGNCVRAQRGCSGLDDHKTWTWAQESWGKRNRVLTIRLAKMFVWFSIPSYKKKKKNNQRNFLTSLGFFFFFFFFAADSLFIILFFYYF